MDLGWTEDHLSLCFLTTTNVVVDVWPWCPVWVVSLQKLLLVSLLQGAGGVQGTGTSQKTSGNVAVGAFPPTTQASVSNGTNQTGNTHGAVMSSGAEKEGQNSHSVRPLLAAASLSLQGATGTDVLSELPAASTNSPSNYPTEPVALGNTGHKVGTITHATHIMPPPYLGLFCGGPPTGGPPTGRDSFTA